LRRLGELELAVMEFYWRSARKLTVPDVQDHLKARELAYTTTMTIVHRLWKKGFLERTSEVRPHAYRAAIGREDYSADLMLGVLKEMGNKRAALARFVERIGPKEAQILRDLTRKKD
jgi:predicted transcriptional regulator